MRLRNLYDAEKMELLREVVCWAGWLAPDDVCGIFHDQTAYHNVDLNGNYLKYS